MEETVRQEFIRRARHEAYRILVFWQSKVIKPDGSFEGRIDAHGMVDPLAPRGLILTTRLLRTFARAINSGLWAREPYLPVVARLSPRSVHAAVSSVAESAAQGSAQRFAGNDANVGGGPSDGSLSWIF